MRLRPFLWGWPLETSWTCERGPGEVWPCGGLKRGRTAMANCGERRRRAKSACVALAPPQDHGGNLRDSPPL